jgi:uncharacterized membrane protein
MKRITSIDFTRGFVMIVMALDHVRDLIHVDSIAESPTNLTTTSPILFFTRWITYLCAPIFVFLAGTSAGLSIKRSNDLSKSRQFLFRRGLYLIILEFAVVNFALFFDPGFHLLLFEVIATIGFGFIILSLVAKLSPKTTGIIGLVIIFCHNLAPLIPLSETSAFKTILMPLFSPGAFPLSANRVFVMAYPPIPWLGIMLVGFASAKFFEYGEEKRKQLFIKIGSAALLLFIVIRFINIYGDSFPWSAQKTSLFTFLSFMNITKYPPSLVFCLCTLGIMFFVLSASEGRKNRISQIVSVYGKVPLFYFLVHFFLIHLILLAVLLLQGFHWSQVDFASGNFGRPKGIKSGLPLWAVYLIWMSVVVLLYRPCKWYGAYKSQHRQWWLKYL